MSVINRMLQDLQSRKTGLPDSPVLVMPTAPRSAGPRRLGGLLVGGTALIAAAAYGPWPGMGSAEASHLPQPVALSQAAPQPTALAASVAVALAPKLPRHGAALTHSVPAHLNKIMPKALPLSGSHPVQVAAAVASSPLPSSASPIIGTVDKRVSAETPRQHAQMLYRQGNELASTGHVRQAVDMALDALKVDPSYSEARQFAVSMMYEQQRVAEAEALAREGLAMSRQQGQLAYLLARMLTERGSVQEAMTLLDQQLNLTADGHGLRAGILSQRGDFKRASQDYQSAVMQQPDNSLWWFGLGVALEALGQSQEARRVYAKAQSLGMDRADLTAFIDQKLKALN